MKKSVLLALIVLVLGLYFGLDLGEYLSLEVLQTRVEENYVATVAIFFIGYIFVAALNLPGAAALTIASGILFGLSAGVALVSFASTLGASASMLISRTLLRDWATRRFSGFLEKVNRGVDEEGATYLFILRLIPIIPFFVINPVFGLTRMPLWKFYLVSQLGMFPATILYVNIGATFGSLEDLGATSVFTPKVLASFVLLAVFPFIARALVNRYRTWRKLKQFKKPRHFDTNLVVVGAGAAGLVSSYIAALVKAKVILIEREAMGGDCLNTGCVPSKALIRSAKAVKSIREAPNYGVSAGEVHVDFAEVMSRVRRVIAKIEPNDSVERYESLGVDCVSGEAELISPYEVKVGERVIRTRNIIIAAGARPRIPNIPGLENVSHLSSDSLWSITDLPRRLLVLGGGAIGCELAQAFSRLGSEVYIAEQAPHLLPNMDSKAGNCMEAVLKQEGLKIYTDTRLVKCVNKDDEQLAVFEHQGKITEQAFDQLLVAVGREANVDGPLLKNLPLKTNQNGTLAVDEYLQTSIPGIYACGDVVGPYQLTHAASHQAWYASVNALFGQFKKFKVNYDALPAVVFTDPEVAHLGKTEAQLQQQGIEYECTHFALSELDRAIAEGEEEGFVQVLTFKKTDKLLGVTIVASRAGEMIAEFVSAKKQNKGLNTIISTVHSYPTFGEANKFAAGAWKKNHKPEWALTWLESWFKWQAK